MNRLIIVGSPRIDGRSAHLADLLFESCIDECPDDELALAPVSTLAIEPCQGCDACKALAACAASGGASDGETAEEACRRCVIDDDMAEVYELIDAADELVVVSPVYFAGAPAQLKALLDRLQPYYFTDLRTRLLGSYQPANAALAIEAAEALRTRGWAVYDDAVRRGIAETAWPGRFEIVRAASGEPTVVVDGGHNPQGARALADSLADVFPGRKPVFVVGVLEDKDYPAMLETVLPLGAAFVCVAPDNPRALPADKLARAIRWTGQDLLGCSACTRPYVARDMADALARARELAGPDGLVCAFGSLYSVGAVKAVLGATA